MRHTLSLPFVLALLPPASFAGDLTIKVDHVRSDRGSILAALYDSEAAFLKQPAARARFKVRAAQGEVKYVFHDLPAGQYALSVFHDENDNGKLDKNFLGVPKEGYGFTNDARGRAGPPTFGNAAFDFDGTDRTVTVTLQY